MLLVMCCICLSMLKLCKFSVNYSKGLWFVYKEMLPYVTDSWYLIRIIKICKINFFLYTRIACETVRLIKTKLRCEFSFLFNSYWTQWCYLAEKKVNVTLCVFFLFKKVVVLFRCIFFSFGKSIDAFQHLHLYYKMLKFSFR